MRFTIFFQELPSRATLLCVAILFANLERAVAEEAASLEGLKLFNEHVHAILVDRCVKCHGGQKTESELDLATRDGLLKGGVNGAAIVPGDAAASYLVKAIKHEEEPHMPENGPKLSAAAVAKLSQWIDLGAPYSKPLVENGAPSGLPKGHAQNWGAGFLPSVFQGTALNPQGAPIDNLSPPPGVTSAAQQKQLEFLVRANRRRLEELKPPEADLAARIENFELAYRMQLAAPEVFDIEREPEHIHKLYGTREKRCGHFAKQVLLARRLVENGVRFVQIYSGGMENERSWDGHVDIEGNHRQFAGETDQPIAALLQDLANTGLLESTLVVCNGEFGRLPIAQTGKQPGRDHNPHAFTTWLAGGGVRGGVHYGETDELGHRAAVDKVSINDLHATILHLIGLDHERLTYRHNGRNFRLTDVAGRVVRELLA